MKVNRIANIALAVTLTMTIVSGGYWAYADNVGNVRQSLVQHQRTKAQRRVTVKDQVAIDPTAVQRKVTEPMVGMKNVHRLGSIAIPNLNISLPIYDQPYNNQTLSKGAQQMKAVNDKNIEVDTAMGNGNYVLVAHNYNDGKSMLSPLQQYINKDAPYLVNGKKQGNDWLNGAPIYLANDQGVFEYQIDSQRTLDAKDTSIRRNTDQAELNVITCLFPSDQYRIDTHAKLVKQWEWSNVPNDVLRALSARYNLKEGV